MQKFSVAMSVYKNDSAAYFERALESITDIQTIKPNEIVLVVDGPVSDDINNVIEKYSNKYPIFNVIRLENNLGLGNALKLAVEKAKFDLIARMDSDDVSVPDRFEQQLLFMDLNSDVDVVGGNITEFIGEESNIVASRIVPNSNLNIRKYMKKRCGFNHVTVMYKKESVLSVGNYQDWFWNEDYYLWIRMWLNNSIFANTGTVLVNVRTGADMYARRGGDKYYKSEKGLQKYMLDHGMIGKWTYFTNCVKRFIIQKVISNSIRGWVFKTLARK